MGQIRLAYRNDKMPPQTKPSNSTTSPANSAPPQTDSCHLLLDRLLELQPDMESMVTRRLKVMVKSAERIAREPSLLALTGIILSR